MPEEWIEVESSMILAVVYDEWGTLFVRFKNESIYRYSGVSRQLFDEFLAADSQGTFFNAKIKDGFPYQKVGD